MQFYCFATIDDNGNSKSNYLFKRSDNDIAKVQNYYKCMQIQELCL